MTVNFKNESFSCVDIYIGKSHIVLPSDQTYSYSCAVEIMPLEIKFSISSEEYMPNDTMDCLNVSTIVSFNLVNLSDIMLIIKKKIKQFQNYTSYQYLIIESQNSVIQNIKHEVKSYESLNATKTYIQGSPKNIFLHIFKKSLIDMLLDGFILSALIGWVFSWKASVVLLITVFLIALIINSIKQKTSKSKFRILNWDKDMELPDDIEYFIKNLEKFCN